MGGSSMLRGLGTPFLLAGAMVASSMRLGIPDEHRSSLLGGFLHSSPWPSSSPPAPPQLHSSQKFPNSLSNQQQQGLRRQESSLDLQADLLRQYFALQGLHRQSQILDHLLQQPPFRRVQRSRTNEHHSQGEEDEREKEEDEGEEDGSSEEEFNQHLSLFPELLLDSQAGPRRMLRQKKEGEATNFIKKTLLPYPRLG